MTEAAPAAAASLLMNDESSSSIRRQRPQAVNVLCLGMSYVDWNESIRQLDGDADDGGGDRQPTPKQQRQQQMDGTCISPSMGADSKSESSAAPGADRSLQASASSALLCWRDAVEAVRRNELSEMDGRDLARCLAVESLLEGTNDDGSRSSSSQVRVYTASQEEAATYRGDRHVHGNFCRRGWARRFAEQFPGVQFDQVTLDYFWIPPGWDQSHWTKAFFEQTLPDLCRYNLLRGSNPTSKNDSAAPPLDSFSSAIGTASPTSSMHVSADIVMDAAGARDDTSTSTHRAAVYLPFTLHCFRMVLACRRALLQFYDVSFVRQHDLHQILLWRGTQQIGEHFMQTVLGKRLDQENVYCRPGHGFVRTIQQQEDSTHVASHELLDYARRIPNLRDVRFIALRPVRTATMPSNEPGMASACGGSPTRQRKSTAPPGRILGLVVNEGSGVSPSKQTATSSAKRALDFSSLSVGHPSERQRKRRMVVTGLTEPTTETLDRSTREEDELHDASDDRRAETAPCSADDGKHRLSNAIAGLLDGTPLAHTSPAAPIAARVTPTPLPAFSPRRSPRLASTPCAAKRKLF